MVGVTDVRVWPVAFCQMDLSSSVTALASSAPNGLATTAVAIALRSLILRTICQAYRRAGRAAGQTHRAAGNTS